jgi:hypothetical protein
VSRGYELEPHGWDVHFDAASGEMLDTCGPKCRTTKGLPERIPGLVLR